jgi:hypothetical protein
LRSGSVSSAALAALFASLLATGSASAGVAAAGLAVEPFAPLPLLYAADDSTVAPAAPGTEAPSESGARVLSDGARPSLQPSSPGAPRNPRKALLLSLLLPGAGELYQGHRGRATGFFISEGAIWTNYVAWEISGHLRRNDYIEQAQLGAGVGVDSGNDDYWRLVGQYQRSSGTGPGAYEETLRREARVQYPSDPAQQDLYVAERLPTGDRAWSWSTAAEQAYYQKTRQNANRAFSRAKYSFGFAILNRLVSALDTQILHRSDRRDAEGRAGWGETRILSAWTADGGGVLLIQRRF